MPDMTCTWPVDLVVRYAMLATVVYAVAVIHRERRFAAREAERSLLARLAELLPLPHLGDHTTLAALLSDIAPGCALAIYSTGEPVLLVFRRDEREPPGRVETRWVEHHREALRAGEIVREQDCGTLIPLPLRDGALVGALLVATLEQIPLDDTARATLRHIAGLVALAPKPRRLSDEGR